MLNDLKIENEMIDELKTIRHLADITNNKLIELKTNIEEEKEEEDV